MLLIYFDLWLLAPSNLAILSSLFWINDCVNLSISFLILDLWYKVKTLLSCYLLSSISLFVGIYIVPLLWTIPVTGSTKSLSLRTSSGLENLSVTPICIFYVLLFLLFQIKLYNVLRILFTASSISIAFSFLALNLKVWAMFLWALNTSVGIKDGLVLSLISFINSLFPAFFTSYTVPKSLV